MKRLRRSVAAALLSASALPPALAAQTIRINGAGATFPYPIYSKWLAEYSRQRADVQINYQSIGSGGGIRQVMNRTVFFGATDSPMTDAQLRAAPGRILHLPMALGAVVPVYNLPGAGELSFSGRVLADIFLGRVTRWNDAAIAALNPGATLPATDITVVHRADGSGTTYVWVEFLSKASPEFRAAVGINAAVKWPTGVGARGNEGAAGLVKQISGSIAYVELNYALQAGIPFGRVRNAAGEAVKASVESMTAAALARLSAIPADLRVSITDAPGTGVYPISSFTWLLLYEDSGDPARARAMVDFVRWALTAGQKFCAALGYAPLPEQVAKESLALAGRVRIS